MKRAALPVAWLLAGAAATLAPAVHAETKTSRAPVAQAAPAPRAATPQSREADAHAAKGAALLKKRKTAEALAEYVQAYAAASEPKHLYRVAQLREQTADTAGAARAYTEYLKVAPEGAEERGTAMGEMQRLLSGVGRVTVKCDQPGVTIAIDGAPMTVTPASEPILVGPGPHTITATKAGFATTTRSVTAKAEDTVAVSLEMTVGASAPPSTLAAPVLSAVAQALPSALPASPPRVAAAGPATPPAPASPSMPAPPASDRKPNDTAQSAAPPSPAPPPPSPAALATNDTPVRAPLVETKPSRGGSGRFFGWTAAGALAAGTVVTTIVAIDAASTFDSKKQMLGVTKAELEDAQGGARTWTLVSVGLGAAAVAVATITILSTKSKPTSERATSLPPSPRLAAVVSPTSVRLQGSF